MLRPVGAFAQGSSAGDAISTLLNSGAFIDASLGTTDAFISALAKETSTFPIGSAASGFAWTFDNTLGVQTRRTNSFGALFAERPITNGRGKTNVALSFQRTVWDSVAGQPLSALTSTFRDAPLRIDEIDASQIKLTTERVTFSASYGVTDRIDVTLVVPFAHASVSGTASQTNQDPAAFRSQSVDAKGSSSGVGDIVVRGKITVPSGRWLDLAGGIDVRIPSGDRDNLLGLGVAQTKVSAIAAKTVGAFAPHVNVGYTFGGDLPITGEPPILNQPTSSSEIDWTVGTEIAPRPAVTIVGDVIGRSLRRTANFIRSDIPGPIIFGSQIFYEVATVNLLLGSVATKINIGGLWLLTVGVAFPLNDNGVKPRLTPIVGFERAF